MGEAFAWPALNQDARAELAAVREQARTEGYAQGLREGRDAAVSEIAELRQALVDAIRSLAETRRALAETDQELLSSQLIELVTVLIGAELETNARIIENLMAEAVAAVTGGRMELTIRISPEDVGWLGDLEAVAVEVDPAQPQGSVVVASPDMDLVFDPRARLEELLAENREEPAGADAVALPPTH